MLVRLLPAIAMLIVLAIPAGASGREPIVSYVDGAGTFRLYDAQLDRELPPPPVPVPPGFPQFRWGMSLDGRYIVFNDADKRLHLLDRATGAEVPLPGIDIDADSDGVVDVNPGSLTVSNSGLTGFDANGNGPARVYSSVTKTFLDTGLDPDPANPSNGHRQTELSGDGRFLATTCLASGGCIVDLGSGSNPYVQNLTTKQDTAFPNVAGRDEEHPCIDGDGSLVGNDRQHPINTSPRDVFIFDRSVSPVAPLTLAAINDPVKEDAYCVLDSAGDYVGHLFDNTAFKLYERASGSFVTLPPGKTFDERSTLSAPYSPPTGPGPGTSDTTAPALTGLSMTRRRFRVGRRSTPTTAQRAPAGTAFRYTLSEPAQVSIRIERSVQGLRLRVGGKRRCVARTRSSERRVRRQLARTRSVRRLDGSARRRRLARLIGRSRCTAHRRAGTLQRSAAAGANRTAFSGRIGRRALGRGPYRAALTAADAAGNRSGPRRIGFRVVGR